jgi:hypothetical protein
MEEPEDSPPGEAFFVEVWLRKAGNAPTRAGQDPVEARYLARRLDDCGRPILPDAIRAVILGSLACKDVAPATVAFVDQLLFSPWLTPERRGRLKAEMFRSPSAPAEVSACFEAPADVHGIGRFLEEACELALGATCRPADLFQHYRGWAGRAGLQPVGKQGFYRGLEAILPSLRRRRPRGKDGKQSKVVLFIGVHPLSDALK